MDKHIVVQLIATGGILLTALVTIVAGYLIYGQALRARMSIKRETQLLKDALFYRMLIVKYVTYQKELGKDADVGRWQYWEEVKEDLDFTPESTEPARIKRRLRQLKGMTEEIEVALEQLKKLKMP